MAGGGEKDSSRGARRGVKGGEGLNMTRCPMTATDTVVRPQCDPP